MLKWSSLGSALRLDLVRAVSSALDWVGEALAGSRRAEAKIPHRIQPRFDRSRMFGDSALPLGGRRGPMPMPGMGPPPQHSLDAQRRLEKLERELREARTQASAEHPETMWRPRDLDER